MNNIQKSIPFICVGIILLLVFGKQKKEMYHYYPDHSYGLDSYSVEENRLNDINSEIRKAQNKVDSINQVKQFYTNGFISFSGSYTDFIGLVKLDGQDFKPGKQDFLFFGGMGLKINEQEGPNYLVYSTERNQGYLSRTKLTKNKQGYLVSYVKHPVSYRYSSAKNNILVPVTSEFMRISIEVMMYALIIIALFIFLFLLFTFFKFLIAISKNHAFMKTNVMRLKNMSMAFFFN